MIEALHQLTSVFGALMLVALAVAGLVMMFTAAHGREILKNVFVALGIFVLGSMLLPASCAAIRALR